MKNKHTPSTLESSVLSFVAGAGAGILLTHYLCNEDLEARKEQLSDLARDFSEQVKETVKEKVGQRDDSGMNTILARLKQGEALTKRELADLEAALYAKKAE